MQIVKFIAGFVAGFSRLREKCPWCVQKIAYDDARGCQGAWHD